jgi:hypothetical protein
MRAAVTRPPYSASLRRTCVAPESARMGVIEHNRGGCKESSSSESLDSKAAKGLRWEKRETGLGFTVVGRRGKLV